MAKCFSYRTVCVALNEPLYKHVFRMPNQIHSTFMLNKIVVLFLCRFLICQYKYLWTRPVRQRCPVCIKRGSTITSIPWTTVSLLFLYFIQCRVLKYAARVYRIVRISLCSLAQQRFGRFTVAHWCALHQPMLSVCQSLFCTPFRNSSTEYANSVPLVCLALQLVELQQHARVKFP